MESHRRPWSPPDVHPKPVPSVRPTKPSPNTNTLSHSYETMQSPVGISKSVPQGVHSQDNTNSSTHLQTSDESSRQAGMGYPDENAILSLSELVEQCSHLLPLRVKAVSGFMAENVGDPTIHVDDVCNVHAVKQTEVATIVDSRRQKYRLPLHSSARFGVIGTLAQACSVYDLLSVKPQPPIVAVSDRYIGSSSEFSLSKNEVLILDGVLQKSDGFHKVTALKAFSITDSKQKFITGKCNVLFSTDPADTKLYLSEIIEHAPHLLPCRAFLFVSEEQMKLPKHQVLTKKPVTIEKQQTETSLLISFRSDTKSSSPVYIDIPTSIDIDVHVLNPSNDEEDYSTLYEDTQTLVYEYDPTKLQACVNANDDDTYMTQAQLLKALRQGYETTGTKIKTSGIERDGHIYEELAATTRDVASVYQDVNFSPNPSQVHSGVPQPATYTKQRKTPPLKPMDVPKGVTAQTKPYTGKTDQKPRRRQTAGVPLPSTASKPTSETVSTKAPPTVVPRRSRAITSPTSDIGTYRAPSPNAPPLPVKNKQTTRPNIPPKSKPPSPNTETSKTELVVENVREQTPTSTVNEPGIMVQSEQAESDSALTAINESLRLLIGKVDKIEERQSLFEREISQIKSHGAAKVKSDQPLQVSSMTRHDVQNLLDAMDMPQYKDAFSREWVDGEVFKELDEQALENDLGVTSKLHRIKLMKVITGVYPLEMYSK